MTALNIDRLSATQLSQLLRIEDAPVWGTHDSADALRHQLSAPLISDLGYWGLEAADVKRLEKLMARRNVPAGESFLAHLTSAAPVLEVLQAVKQFARSMRHDSASPLKGAPATVLYFAVVAAAMVGCETRVTQLGDEQLLSSFQWAQHQAGAETLVGLFREAHQQLKQASSENTLS